MEHSENIKNISVSLANFRKEVRKIDRNSEGYNYNYASLENVLDSINPPLEKSGLIFSQFPNGDYGLTTILIDIESGEYFKTTSKIIPVKDDAQGRGSAITYLRRYHLVSILGLTVEDDDGEKASHSRSKKANNRLPWLNKTDKMFEIALKKLKSNETTIDKIKKSYRLSKEIEKELRQ